MAQSPKWYSSNQYIYYYIELIENSRSVTNNYTNVTVRVWVGRDNNYTTYGSGTVYCGIDGTTYSATITTAHKITGTRDIKLFERTMNIPHNNDGTKSLSLTARITHDRFSGSLKTWTPRLTSIARASTISKVDNFTTGDTIPITINRSSSRFTHNVYVTLDGNFIGNQEIDVTGEMDFGPTQWQRIYDNMPDSVRTQVVFNCETYDGTTKIGNTTRAYVYVTLHSDIRPSFDHFTYEDAVTTIKNNIGEYVKGRSKIKYSISGTPGEGTTMRQVTFSVKGFWNSNKSTGTTDYLPKSGTVEIIAKLEDNRGRTQSRIRYIEVLDYDLPRVDNLEVYRVGTNNLPSELGNRIRVLLTAESSSLQSGTTEKNSISYVLSYSERGENQWTTLTSGSTQSNTISLDRIFDNIDIAKSYDVKLVLTDALGEQVEIFDTVPSGGVTMSWGKLGIGVGKIYEEGALDVGGQVHIHTEGEFGGSAINFRNNRVSPHNYLSWYNGANERGGYFGFSTLAHNDIVLNNEMPDGGIRIISNENIRFSTGSNGRIRLVTDSMSREDSSGVFRVWDNGEVERGFNSNGEYIKYPNGILVCTRSEVIWNSDFPDRNLGAGTLSKTTLTSYSFPVEFTQLHYSAAQLMGSSNATFRSNAVGIKLDYGTTTGTPSLAEWRNPAIFHTRDETSTNMWIRVRFFAIGRWD